MSDYGLASCPPPRGYRSYLKIGNTMRPVHRPFSARSRPTVRPSALPHVRLPIEKQLFHKGRTVYLGTGVWEQVTRSHPSLHERRRPIVVLPQVQRLGFGPVYQVGRVVGDQLGEGVIVSQFNCSVLRGELLQRRRHMLIE